MIFLWVVLAVYGLASVVALAFYWYDKRQAKNNQMRISEKTLHLIEALGGWPGALLAQQWFRHKTQKQPFQWVFRLIVAGHIALWSLGGYLYFR
jgi:uncharacterized membrane protein YsdA (DUF1294 family)